MVKRVGLLAAMLTLVLGSGTVAQEPSPEPPPWFGGRVEMPEHGFAVMVPDGWLAFDLAGDVEEQARAATAAIYPDASEAAIESSAGYVRSLQDRGQLAVLDPSAFSNCTLLVGPAVGRDLESLASGMYDFVSNDERVLHAEPPQAMTLPAGLARLVTHGGEAYESAAYMGEGARKAFMVECRAAERPEDDWLSIVETLEWLPASEPRHASSPPWFGGESVEMSEDGFAMTVPDGWAAIDLTRDVDEQVRILVSALDPIASDEKLQAHVEAWSGETPGHRLALVNTSNGDMCDLVTGCGSRPRPCGRSIVRGPFQRRRGTPCGTTDGRYGACRIGPSRDGWWRNA